MQIFQIFTFILHSFFSFSSFLQASTALNPDDQLTVLKNIRRQEKKSDNLSEKDYEIINYYLNEVRIYLFLYYLHKCILKLV